MQIIPFLSWDFVNTGGVAWDDDGKPIYCDIPDGIERRAISYAETDDFARWPATRPIHHHLTEDHLQGNHLRAYLLWSQ